MSRIKIKRYFQGNCELTLNCEETEFGARREREREKSGVNQLVCYNASITTRKNFSREIRRFTMFDLPRWYFVSTARVSISVANLPRQLTYATSQIDFEVAMRRGEVEDRCLYLRNREVRGACFITTQITVKLPALCNEPLGGSLVTMLRTRIIKATNKISLLFMSGGKTSVVFLQKREFFSITRRYALLSLAVDHCDRTNCR